ncbi:uncharacterized protein LOC143293859 [Babylonia areolata]|uniref:uncharacterized protein LOC143293859 n=1 Tax=Babylonia areolata TaxID=304850 RepID=UPI003FD2AE4A
MPPPKTKPMKGNAAKKEQIAEKVKEIQQRQKNWMRQRDEHLNTNNEPVLGETLANGEHFSSSVAKAANRRDSMEHTPQGADILRVHHNSSQHLASEVSDKLNVKVKHGFGAWLQSRKPGDDSKNDTDSSLVSSKEEYFSGTHNSNNHFHKEISAPSSSGVSSLRNSSRSYPLSPAEFDNLADSIAAKVKKDLGIKHSNGARFYNEGAEAVDHRLKQEKTFVQGSPARQSGHKAEGSEGTDNDNDTSVDVSCHRCPFCSSLMATPAHVPMLLVPCGHTVCKRCSTSHTCCRLCGTRVRSLTMNIMLQHIIQEFHRKGHQGTTSSSHSLPAPAQGRERERESGLPVIPPKTTSKYSDVNYSSQLHSLQERQATLQGEAQACRKERDQVGAKVKRAEKQVKAIEKEESSLERQVQELQEQLRGLREHKEEYAGECRRLQEEFQAASQQVVLVEGTLKSLGEEIDKVQFLAEGQEDVYLQRQSQYR